MWVGSAFGSPGLGPVKYIQLQAAGIDDEVLHVHGYEAHRGQVVVFYAS